MDTHDKQFDDWMKNTLSRDIPVSKQNRLAAWEQIRLTASQPNMSNVFVMEEDFSRVTAPIVAHEAFYVRMWHWVNYFITQETRYHKAHANSVQHYKAKPNYSGGLTLYNLELMRHRWTCAV